MSRDGPLLKNSPEWKIPHGPSIRAGGLGEYFNPDGTITEVYSSTCSHCQHVTEFPNRRKMFEHVDVCRGCMKLICLGCAGKPCVTWLKKCDIEEAVARRKMLG
jgi:hypothetical protein